MVLKFQRPFVSIIWLWITEKLTKSKVSENPPQLILWPLHWLSHGTWVFFFCLYIFSYSFHIKVFIPLKVQCCCIFTIIRGFYISPVIEGPYLDNHTIVKSPLICTIFAGQKRQWISGRRCTCLFIFHDSCQWKTIVLLYTNPPPPSQRNESIDLPQHFRSSCSLCYSFTASSHLHS